MQPPAWSRTDEQLEDVHEVVNAVGGEPDEAEETERADGGAADLTERVQLAAEQIGDGVGHDAIERRGELGGALALDDVADEQADQHQQRNGAEKEVEAHRCGVIERVRGEQPLHDLAGDGRGAAKNAAHGRSTTFDAPGGLRAATGA